MKMFGRLAVLIVATVVGCVSSSVFGADRCEPSEPADLKVGIVSDVHVSPPERCDSQGAIDTFRRVLTFFRQEKVDAVIIAGDLTNGGEMKELRIVAGIWNEVFGKGADAPVKVFVSGNHERNYFEGAKRKGDLTAPAYADGLYRDIRKNWKELFDEEWTPFFVKEVKGYAFVGAHWLEWRDEQALRAFLAANRDKLDPPKPFFYVQHDSPPGTCYGTWARWDGGPAERVLADYPNAVAFSGHTHYSLTDPRCIWQGAFTSVGTAALRWTEAVPGGREDVKNYNGRYKRLPESCEQGSQGMVMSVRGDRIVFERYDFRNMEKLGDDWEVQVLPAKDGERTFSFERRRAQSRPPQFAADARIAVDGRKDGKGVTVTFPAAVAADDLSRVFDYEIVAESAGVACTNRVFPPGLQLNMKRMPPTVTCTFGTNEVPNADFRFRVTPLNAFGLRGKPLVFSGQGSDPSGGGTPSKARRDY